MLLRFLLPLLLALSACSIAPASAQSDGAPIRDGDPGSRAHYRSSSWEGASSMMPPATISTMTSEEEAALRVDRALDRKQHLTPSELASAAPSILPPGTIHKPLKDEEVYRLLRNFAFDNTNNSSPLPQKPTPAEVSSALVRAEAEKWIARPLLLSLASDKNTSRAFMALADSSQGGVVNKEHEFNAWSARDDPHFDLESWSGGSSSSPQIPASIDRAFNRADWTADQRRGINASAAERLGFGDRVNELFLTMDENGDGKLTLEELSERFPADTPLPASASSAKRHPIYAYTPENGNTLAKALLRAFDADGDGKISKKTPEEEAAAVVEALAALRAGEGTRSRAGRQLIAALVLGDKYGPSATITEKEFAAYESRARESGEMSVAPPPSSGVARWFEKNNGGKKSSTVDEFVALADKNNKSG